MTSQQEITLESITRTCAQLVLDNLHNSPARQFLEMETSQIIKKSLLGDQHADSTAQIIAALNIAQTLEPRKIASKMRYDVSLAENQIDLIRQKDTGSSVGSGERHGATVSIVAPPGIPIRPILATLGFETYETLPSHVVTPEISPRPSGAVAHSSLHVIQGMLVLLGEAAGLNFYLAHVASLGGVQYFLRDGYERTRSVEFEPAPTQIIEFLKNVDIKATLESTTVEAHGNDVVLFSIPNLPMPVLGYLGTNGVNVVRNAEELVQALLLSGAGEVSGAQLIARAAKPDILNAMDKSPESERSS
jgi:hypothetical protein